MKKLFCILLALAVVLTFGGCASKETEKQEMVEYPNRIEDTLVNDFAGVLSTETKEEIADAGDKALDKLKTQVLVVSVESLGGESVQEYARELSKRWGLDDADKGIGALLLVAKEEREVHISIGYGWDKLITDEEIDNILETYAVSYIKNGNLNDGIKESYLALISKMEEKMYPKRTDQFYVNDFANVLSVETEEIIFSLGENLQKGTSAQVVVVTIDTLNGQSIEDYALGLGRKWGIISPWEVSAVLLVLAIEEREIRIEVSNGLEDAITDAQAGTMLDTYAVPYLKNDDFDTGIKSVYTALVDELTRYLR